MVSLHVHMHACHLRMHPQPTRDSTSPNSACAWSRAARRQDHRPGIRMRVQARAVSVRPDEGRGQCKWPMPVADSAGPKTGSQCRDSSAETQNPADCLTAGKTAGKPHTHIVLTCMHASKACIQSHSQQCGLRTASHIQPTQARGQRISEPRSPKVPCSAMTPACGMATTMLSLRLPLEQPRRAAAAAQRGCECNNCRFCCTTGWPRCTVADSHRPGLSSSPPHACCVLCRSVGCFAAWRAP